MAPSIGSLCLENLYRDYSGMAFRICLRYLRDREEAREVMQETFLNVNRGLSGFQGLSSPKTWIHRIAVNQCLTHLDRNRREREGICRFFSERGDEPASEDGSSADNRMEAESLLEKADPTTRRILYLSFGQGLTHSQIAGTLGVSRVAVTRRITRFKALASELVRFREPAPEEGPSNLAA